MIHFRKMKGKEERKTSERTSNKMKNHISLLEDYLYICKSHDKIRKGNY